MKYGSKNIDEMSNEELTKAKATLDNILQNYNKRVAQKKVGTLDNKKQRHEGIEFNINPKFTEIQQEIEKEIESRGLSHV